MQKPYSWIIKHFLVVAACLLATACSPKEQALPTVMVIPSATPPATMPPRATLPPTWTPTSTWTFTPNYSPTPSPTITFTPQPTGTPAPTIERGIGVIAFERSGQQAGRLLSDIYLLDLATGSEVNLTQTSTLKSAPGWSPDGTQIVFAQTDEQKTNDGIYIQAVDGSQPPVLVVKGVAAATQPDWSPDGRTIIFQGDVSGYSDLFMVNVDGSKLVQLTNTDRIDESEPHWSPDGSRILYEQRTNRSSEIQANIIVVNAACVKRAGNCADGTIVGRGQDAVWSPNGQVIAYSGPAGTGIQVCIMSMDGSNIQQVTHERFGGVADLPSWSPDGSQLVYRHTSAEGEWELFVINANGTDEHPITNNPLRENDPAWKP
ncbi:MAG: hypothetical protein ABI690_17605 [Chloroflexota bacterium]